MIGVLVIGLVNLICGCWLLLGFPIAFGLSNRTKKVSVNNMIDISNYLIN